MNSVLEYEKKIYFRDKKHFLISWITREHNFYIWKYVYYLRREEAAKNNITKYWYRRKKNRLGSKLGILINGGTCARGLCIWHYGSVIINGYAKLGENVILHGQNCIGNDGKDEGNLKAPVIGNNVDIGIGASIIGDIYIADDVKIGAGAVVTKSCYVRGATLIGIPARIMEK